MLKPKYYICACVDLCKSFLNPKARKCDHSLPHEHAGLFCSEATCSIVGKVNYATCKIYVNPLIEAEVILNGR